MITIVEVKTNRQLRTFIDFPTKLLGDNPNYTPYIYEDEVSNLKPGKNPAARYCEFKLFLAYKGEKVVGRVCAILNHFSNRKYNQKRIRFNRIDMIDDLEVTKALIHAVEQFGREKGMEEINGPLGYSDQDKEGLLIEGFDEHNMFITFYHPPYYKEHLEQLGFTIDVIWNEYRVFIPEQADERLQKIADYTARKQGFKLVKLKSKNRRKLLPVVIDVLSLVNRAYDKLYGYVPIDQDQMQHLANQYIPLLNLDYLQLVYDKNDKLVAFGLMIPTPVFALKKHNGHLLPFGWISFLKALKTEKILDMALVAAEPELQGSGVMTIVFADAIKMAIKNGVKYAETGPELASNQYVQSLWTNFNHRKHKQRACYLKKIED